MILSKEQLDAHTKLELEQFAVWFVLEQAVESLRGEKPKLSSEYVRKYLSR